MGRTSGIVQAEGRRITSAADEDLVTIYKMGADSGQFEPRDIAVGDLITGGGTSFTPESVIFAGDDGNLSEDEDYFQYDSSDKALTVTGRINAIDVVLGTVGDEPGTLTILAPGVPNDPDLRGAIYFQATPNSEVGNFAMNIVNAAIPEERNYTIPNAGGDADFMMTAGAQLVYGAKEFANSIVFDEDIILGTLGRKLGIKGTDGSMGLSVLTAGEVVVANANVTGLTRILLTRQGKGSSTGIGSLDLASKTNGVSFTIQSLKADATVETGDTSSVLWFLLETVI